MSDEKKGREQEISIVFDGPPGPESGRFVEVETRDGKGLSCRVGECREREDGFWALDLAVVMPPEVVDEYFRKIEQIREASGGRAWFAGDPLRHVWNFASVSDRCRATGHQNCSFCNDFDCCDNTAPRPDESKKKMNEDTRQWLEQLEAARNKLAISCAEAEDVIQRFIEVFDQMGRDFSEAINSGGRIYYAASQQDIDDLIRAARYAAGKSKTEEEPDHE